MAQSSTYPSTLPSLEIIDQRLKQFVHLHHLDLLRAINYQISKLNSNILIKRFTKQLSTYHLTPKQVQTFIAL
jgi:EAL domain-containing protein (putative c-di-GMP-specific phosphodiesterase class I)